MNWGEVKTLASIPLSYLNIFIWGGGNEELGWRGVARPSLRERYRALVSSLITGVVWAAWHAPAGIIERGVTGWAVDLPSYAVIVSGISIVATLRHNSTGGSRLRWSRKRPDYAMLRSNSSGSERGDRTPANQGARP